MTTRRIFQRLCQLMVFCIVLAPFALPQQQPSLAQAQKAQPASTLPAFNESEPNNTITPTNQANQIGPSVPTKVWDQTITGKIATEDDVDWYAFTLSTPASNVDVTLTNLPADYDLVLASGPITGTEYTDDGLEDIATIGGSIRAIGGSIRAIGGSIRAIGGSIRAIGGSIRAIGGNITDASAQQGTTPESISSYLWQPGTYYIAVAGFNGAFSDQPYTLHVAVDGSAWQELGANVQPAPDARFTLSGDRSSVETLYLMSSSRMKQRYIESDATVDQIKSTLGAMASTTNGYVLDLDDLNRTSETTLVSSTETITDAYALSDADPANPLQTNRIARLIDNVITAATVRNPSSKTGGPPPMPNIKQIVLVGGDGIIPFYRVPDLTSVSNEGTYATYMRQIDPSGIIDSNSPLGAALHYRMILTDNLYGADGAYRFPGQPLYLPDRAVGRLVEQPDNILSYLQAYQTGPRLIDATSGRALVTGYDFLIDQAHEVSRTLTTAGLTTTGLINDTWNENDLEQTWFDGQIGNLSGTGDYARVPPNPYQLQSINAHFDHWQTIPATGTNTFLAQALLQPTHSPSDTFPPYFFNRLCYSVGCHSGLSVDDADIAATTSDPTLYAADFPEAYLKQAGNWIGNTGYGYGTDQIAYSERLSQLLTEALARRVLDINSVYVGQPIGAALVEAKQRYARTAAHLDPYDAKVLMETTLYGLPFIPVQVKNPQAPPIEETQVDRTPPVLAPAVTTKGVLERVITFTNQLDQGTVDRTGSNYLELSNVQVEDSFVQAGFPATSPHLLTAAAAGLPTLPQFSYNLTARGPLGSGQRLEVKDVEFIGGSYDVQSDYNPQISQVITQDLDMLPRGVEPPFEAGDGVWYPEKFYDVSDVGAGDEEIDQLLVTAAQFRAAAGGTRGAMRPYKQMVFKVIYIDPAAPDAQSALNDTDAPEIGDLEVTPKSGGSGLNPPATLLTVEVQDAVPNSIAEVNAVYVDNQNRWVLVPFQQIDGQHWSTSIPVPSDSAQIIVSSRDTSGNVTVFGTKGAYAVTVSPSRVYLPVVRH